MTIKRTIVILGIVLVVLPARTGFADEDGDSYGPLRAVIGGFTTAFIAGNAVTLAGTSARIGQENVLSGFAIAGIIVGVMDFALGAIQAGVFHDKRLSLGVGISAVATGLLNIGVGAAYLILREEHNYQNCTRISPTVIADREGNLVPGVAVQVVGW